MMNKDTARRAYAVVASTFLGIGVTAVAYKAWHQLPMFLIVTIFIVVWANLFFATSWFFSRPDALRRSLPITGAERRRTNKHFYEWLRSQGRR
jgi:hypothetical protein